MSDRIIRRNGDFMHRERHSWDYDVDNDKVTRFYCVQYSGGGGISTPSSTNHWCGCWTERVPEISGDELEKLWGGKGYITPGELDEFAMRRKYGL